MNLRILACAVAAAALCACTQTGNIERNTAGGAAIGAAVGAVIGNNTGSGDAGDGAETGAIVGGALGAWRGVSQDQRLADCRNAPPRPTYYDQQAGRYYYIVPGTNRTCWDNGQPR